MFDNLKTDEAIKEQGDSLGGFILDSAIYDMAIDLAYFDTSQGGATSLNFHFKGKNGVNLRQTFWVTSGKAKGATNYYLDKNGDKQYLPGFSQANSICKLAGGDDMANLPHETKTIKVWNSELKKEAPMEKEVLTGLNGKEITLGVIRQVVDKNVKNSDGKYVPSGETREENEIDKAFRTSDHLTNAEIQAEETAAVFYDKWKEKNTGTIRQKAKAAKNGAGGTAGTPAGAAGGEPAKSLFN